MTDTDAHWFRPSLCKQALADRSGSFVLWAKEGPRAVWAHTEGCASTGTRTAVASRISVLWVWCEARTAAVRVGQWTHGTGPTSTVLT